MSKRKIRHPVLVLLALLLVAYVLIHMYRYFCSPVTTELAQEYTVDRSLEVQGVAVRDETVLDQAATGNEYYLVENANRVALGQSIATLCDAQSNQSDMQRAEEIKQEIEMLQAAQDTILDYAYTEIFNKEIKSLLSQSTEMASTGYYTDLNELRFQLLKNMAGKSISGGKEWDYSDRIQQLENELSQLNVSPDTEDNTVVTAPSTGYFSNVADGYETHLATDTLKTMHVQDVISVLQSKGSVSAPNTIGKLVQSEKWIFAAVIPKEELTWIQELWTEQQTLGNTLSVSMQFDRADAVATATITGFLEDDESSYAVLLLQSNDMNEELINLRMQNAVLMFQKYTGIRINSSDIRFQEDENGNSQPGVYVLENSVVHFKKVDAIYEESNYMLSKTYYVDSAEQGYVCLFDQIITEGMDLYDGKTIQAH